MFEASISGESGVLHCSIVVGLRDGEECNGVLHHLATSTQMATEHHDHDIDVEGCKNYLLLNKIMTDACSMMVIFMFEASISGESGVLHCSIVVGLRDGEECNGVLHQLPTSTQIAA
jgi:hypothetical protein